MVDEDWEKKERQAAAGRNFRRALIRAGVRPVDVAQLTGATPSRVSNWGKRGVSAQFAASVAAFLKVKPHQISIAQDPDEGESEAPEVLAVEERGAPYQPPVALGRLIDLLEKSGLPATDLALLEELVHRLARRH
jgi:hypothetical protein